MTSKPTRALCNERRGDGTAAGWHRRGGVGDGVMHGDAGGSEGDSRLREVYSRTKNWFVVEASLAHVAPFLTSTFGI